MGTLTDSLFAVLMSWVRALVNGLWALFSSEDTTTLGFLGKNWVMIAVVIIAAGLVIDWLTWLVRWQPYHIWAQRVRRLFGMDDGEEEEEESQPRKAYAAMPPERKLFYGQPAQDFSEEEEEHGFQDEFEEDILEEDLYPQNDLFIDDDIVQQAQAKAEEVSDEELGAYPGMRYGTHAEAADMHGTRRYSALTTEGPGSAEVARRRAEIDAWQMQMQEEARARAEAERRAREAEAARIAEEQRRAREAEAARIAEEQRLEREAEAARIAEEQRLEREAEAARIAEEQRLAQEEYERQMAEYEKEKARYEREMEEYERRKAEYDAQMEDLARRRSRKTEMETAQELEPVQGRRRRSTQKTYGDYISGEAVTQLPDPPQWPQAEKAAQTRKKAKPAQPGDKERTGAKAHNARRGAAGDVEKRPDAGRPKVKKGAAPGAAGSIPAKEKPVKEKPAKENGLFSRMAKMIEPKEDEIASFSALPPRVDMNEAYKPAKTPQGEERRRR